MPCQGLRLELLSRALLLRRDRRGHSSADPVGGPLAQLGSGKWCFGQKEVEGRMVLLAFRELGVQGYHRPSRGQRKA